MKVLWVLFVVSLLVYGATVPEAGAVTQQCDAFARVMTPVVITKVSDLRFGSVSEDGSGGTILLTADGNRSSGGGVHLVSSAPVQAACFTVTGEPDALVAIGCPAVGSLSGCGSPMPVGFICAVTTPPQFDGSGLLAFCVGGKLTVNPGQCPGDYKGTFDVTVIYP